LLRSGLVSHDAEMSYSPTYRHWLTVAGSHLSGKTISKLDGVINYLEAGRWMREHKFKPRWFRDRRDIWESIGTAIGNQPAVYLEFGVDEGFSIRYWAKLLTHPASHLHGFDSFDGLPEKWRTDYEAGHFSHGGRIPTVDDRRVKFFKGWFNETLPKYTVPAEHTCLVINLDADLYSSTSYVLAHLCAAITPGTYIYLDEFAYRYHELKAFDEFMKTSGKSFEAVGATKDLQHVAFVCRS
jgi:hypothetical protein